jgi:hypothetical protein
MIQLPLQVLTGLILLTVAVRELAQLLRHRDDPALRVLAPGLTALALAATLGIPELTLPIMRHLLGYWFGWVIDACWYIMVFAFAAFFVVADPDRDRAAARRIVRTELALCVVSFVVLIVVERLAPGQPRSAALYRSWWSYANTGVSSIYLVAFSAIGIWRGVRYRRTVTHPWLRRALSTMLTGGAAMSIGVNVTPIFITIGHAILGPAGPARFDGFKVVYVSGLLGGQTLLAVGLVLPTVVEAGARLISVRDLRLRMRVIRQTQPLWDALTKAFPYIVLDDEGGRFPRRINEVSDGLAQLAPYLAGAALSVEDGQTGVTDPPTAAVTLDRALRAHAQASPRGEPPYPRLEPEFAGWRPRARWMAELSRCWVELGDRSLDAPVARRR